MPDPKRKFAAAALADMARMAEGLSPAAQQHVLDWIRLQGAAYDQAHPPAAPEQDYPDDLRQILRDTVGETEATAIEQQIRERMARNSPSSPGHGPRDRE